MAAAAAAAAAAAGDGSGGGGGRDDEIEEIAGEVREAEAAAVRKREAAAAAAREAKALESALAARGVRVGEFADDALREQVVGSSSGARVWWDAEQDTLHWPLGMFIGPSWWHRGTPRRPGCLGRAFPAPGSRLLAALRTQVAPLVRSGTVGGCGAAIRSGRNRDRRPRGLLHTQAAARALSRGGHERLRAGRERARCVVVAPARDVRRAWRAHSRVGPHGQARRLGSGRAGHLRRQAPSRSRTAALWAPEQRCGRSAPSSATLEPLPRRRRRHRRWFGRV